MCLRRFRFTTTPFAASPQKLSLVASSSTSRTTFSTLGLVGCASSIFVGAVSCYNERQRPMFSKTVANRKAFLGVVLATMILVADYMYESDEDQQIAHLRTVADESDYNKVKVISQSWEKMGAFARVDELNSDLFIFSQMPVIKSLSDESRQEILDFALAVQRAKIREEKGTLSISEKNSLTPEQKKFLAASINLIGVVTMPLVVVFEFYKKKLGQHEELFFDNKNLKNNVEKIQSAISCIRDEVIVDPTSGSCRDAVMTIEEVLPLVRDEITDALWEQDEHKQKHSDNNKKKQKQHQQPNILENQQREEKQEERKFVFLFGDIATTTSSDNSQQQQQQQQQQQTKATSSFNHHDDKNLLNDYQKFYQAILNHHEIIAASNMWKLKKLFF